MTVSTQASATARRWRKQYRPIAANTNNSRQTSRPADLAAQQRSYQVLCDRAAGPPPRISTADTTSADAALLIGDQNAYAPSVDQFWASGCRSHAGHVGRLHQCPQWDQSHQCRADEECG